MRSNRVCGVFKQNCDLPVQCAHAGLGMNFNALKRSFCFGLLASVHVRDHVRAVVREKLQRLRPRQILYRALLNFFRSSPIELVMKKIVELFYHGCYIQEIPTV